MCEKICTESQISKRPFILRTNYSDDTALSSFSFLFYDFIYVECIGLMPECCIQGCLGRLQVPASTIRGWNIRRAPFNIDILEATTQGMIWKNVKSQGCDSDPGFKNQKAANYKKSRLFCGGENRVESVINWAGASAESLSNCKVFRLYWNWFKN